MNDERFPRTRWPAQEHIGNPSFWRTGFRLSTTRPSWSSRPTIRSSSMIVSDRTRSLFAKTPPDDSVWSRSRIEMPPPSPFLRQGGKSAGPDPFSKVVCDAPGDATSSFVDSGVSGSAAEDSRSSPSELFDPALRPSRPIMNPLSSGYKNMDPCGVVTGRNQLSNDYSPVSSV